MEQPDPQFNELFQELKEEDARHAPAFTRVWANAAAHSKNESPRWRVWPAAVTALALLVCAAAWFAIFRRTTEEKIALPVNRPAPIVLPAPSNEPPREMPQVVAVSDKSVKPAKPRRRKAAPSLPLEQLISQWRSPTDFLLKTPGERWLKEMPRVGVPRAELKPFVIEQNNEMEEL